MAVVIEGEDDTETKFKYLTNKATEGYEMLIMSSAEMAGPGRRGRGETSGVIIAPLCG